MKFKDLNIGDRFKNGSDLIWTKMESCTAYGHIKNQNAVYRFEHPLLSQTHYDHVEDDQEIEKV